MLTVGGIVTTKAWRQVVGLNEVKKSKAPGRVPDGREKSSVK